MATLITIDEIDNFKEIKNVSPETIANSYIETIRGLDEREELEPFIRSILFDINDTPHGPAELVDIFTHRISVGGINGMAGLIIKGKSFKKVKPSDVSHQIYRLEKIDGLKYAIFAASGIILDAAKEQFCSTAERIGCKYAIFDTVDIARLLIAYGFFCPRDFRRISAGRCKCGYSPKKRILNVFQDESLKALERAHTLKQQAGLIVLPPGSGKTRIAAEDAKSFNANSVLYVAHTHEILDVACSEFEAVFGKEKVTMHESVRTLKKPSIVNIATIQYIPFKYFDYLVVDEFHHAAAKSYRKLLESASPQFLLGLTATPFRGDRQDILELCNRNLLIEFELRYGIDAGILAPYHYYGCFDNIDYTKIKSTGTRYDVRDLEKALIIPERDEAIIERWKKHADGKPTLAFCCSHRHAERMKKSFSSHNITAEVYLSNTGLEQRKKLIEKLKTGRVKVLVTVDVVNEGADLPFVECLLFLRPTESQRIFYQQLGRGLRKYVGKSHCIVIDFIGNFKNAFKIVDWQGLMSTEEVASSLSLKKSFKEIMNLPLGCVVHFDEKVLDIFARQSFDPRTATRHNIARILLLQYELLGYRLKRKPTRLDIRRNLYLGDDFYLTVFGSWKNFERVVEGYGFSQSN